MSQTQPAYVTEEIYQSHRARQDTDIRGEFGRQASLIEKGNRQLRNDLTTTFSDKLSNVNGTLSGRIGELSDEVQLLKEEVHQVKDRLDHIEGDVGEVKSSLLDFGVRLERMEKVRMNGTKSRLYDKIEMFGKIVPGVGYQMPRYVPKNAGEFWKLKRDVNAASIRRLIYLVEFYNIDDYQHWHRTQFEDGMTSDPDDMQSDDEQSSSDSASSDLSLEEAVQRYPTQAVEKVATVLGLVEENFERALKYQQLPRRIEKRLQSGGDQPMEEAKRQRLPLRPSPQAPKPTLTLSQLMPDSKSDSLEFDETPLEYDDSSSAVRARAKMIRKLQSGPQSRTPSVKYSDGSPTEPNESLKLEG
ncbi:hypothetical protein ONS95_004496 [Cadophora gregata]|uniref:uncharacterized protein n=1 Tax=Cadophora gregata TaxID=51156 RepID=UPI0026DA77DF|nr:uncharacterized protein ONS95_004496 [Cadophora gregata]KAK0105989.1 hypothetical protein ONS95_004496 [Cadophora gregata]